MPKEVIEEKDLPEEVETAEELPAGIEEGFRSRRVDISDNLIMLEIFTPETYVPIGRFYFALIPRETKRSSEDIDFERSIADILKRPVQKYMNKVGWWLNVKGRPVFVSVDKLKQSLRKTFGKKSSQPPTTTSNVPKAPTTTLPAVIPKSTAKVGVLDSGLRGGVPAEYSAMWDRIPGFLKKNIDSVTLAENTEDIIRRLDARARKSKQIADLFMADGLKKAIKIEEALKQADSMLKVADLHTALGPQYKPWMEGLTQLAKDVASKYKILVAGVTAPVVGSRTKHEVFLNKEMFAEPMRGYGFETAAVHELFHARANSGRRYSIELELDKPLRHEMITKKEPRLRAKFPYRVKIQRLTRKELPYKEQWLILKLDRVVKKTQAKLVESIWDDAAGRWAASKKVPIEHMLKHREFRKQMYATEKKELGTKSLSKWGKRVKERVKEEFKMRVDATQGLLADYLKTFDIKNKGTSGIESWIQDHCTKTGIPTMYSFEQTLGAVGRKSTMEVGAELASLRYRHLMKDTAPNMNYFMTWEQLEKANPDLAKAFLDLWKYYGGK